MSTENQTEVWETTTAGGVWIYQVLANGTEKKRRIKGKSGFRFKIQKRDREASGARFYEAKDDPFRNGTFKRVDVPVEKVIEEIPDYQADQVFSDADLLVLFKSNGMAFHSKAKNLTERNVRRLAVLAEENPEVPKAAQVAFLTEYIMETFRPGGPPTEED